MVDVEHVLDDARALGSLHGRYCELRSKGVFVQCSGGILTSGHVRPCLAMIASDNPGHWVKVRDRDQRRKLPLVRCFINEYKSLGLKISENSPKAATGVVAIKSAFLITVR